MKPKYPVYIISKGRFDNGLTANFFIKDGLDFHIVVEPQEADEYRKRYGGRVLVLPFSNLGKGSTPARNWCWEDSIAKGFDRHWIFDDNIRCIRRTHNNTRIKCNANIATAIIEEFTDRYTNIGMSGFNYTMFVIPKPSVPPYYLNTHLYSGMLINNRMPYRWRMRYNEDTDLNLQVLTNKLCIVAFNAFTIDKMRTLTMKGGNTDVLYKGDGRLKMARSLQAMWPNYVKVVYKFGRPQHSVNWRVFKQRLIRRTDLDWNEISKKQYNINLVKLSEN